MGTMSTARSQAVPLVANDAPRARARRSSVTVRRVQIEVPDPKQLPSSSGRFMAVDLADSEACRPGPVGRWLVLSLILLGAAAVIVYALLHL